MQDSLVRAIARITPSDERVRVALRYGDLPHAPYVLGRLAGRRRRRATSTSSTSSRSPPATDWSGDGERAWADYTEDEQNSHRALAQTLGNLAAPRGAARRARAGCVVPREALGRLRAERDRRDARARRMPAPGAPRRSASARLVSPASSCGSGQRPATVGIDDDGLTPILDAQRRRGWPPRLAARVRVRRVPRRALGGPRRQVPLQPRLQAALGGLPRARRRLQRAARRSDLPRAGVERAVGRRSTRASSSTWAGTRSTC